MAVIINRPFDGGELFGSKTRKPLPGWAAEIGCASWAEALLKFVVSEPALRVEPRTSALRRDRAEGAGQTTDLGSFPPG